MREKKGFDLTPDETDIWCRTPIVQCCLYDDVRHLQKLPEHPWTEFSFHADPKHLWDAVQFAERHVKGDRGACRLAGACGEFFCIDFTTGSHTCDSPEEVERKRNVYNKQRARAERWLEKGVTPEMVSKIERAWTFGTKPTTFHVQGTVGAAGLLARVGEADAPTHLDMRGTVLAPRPVRPHLINILKGKKHKNREMPQERKFSASQSRETRLQLWRDLRGDLRNVAVLHNCAAEMTELGFREAATWCQHTQTCSHGTLHSSQSLEEELAKVRDLLHPVVKKYHPEVSIADIYSLTAVVGVEALGGPKIEWSPGREDEDPDHEFLADRLPGPMGDAWHLRQVFYRMGLEDKDIVVLAGRRTVGRCRLLGLEGAWTRNPHIFDNSYHKVLQQLRNGGKLDERPKQIMLPSDLALIEDVGFCMLVDEYAQDNGRFMHDFGVSLRRLLDLSLGEPMGVQMFARLRVALGRGIQAEGCAGALLQWAVEAAGQPRRPHVEPGTPAPAGLGGAAEVIDPLCDRFDGRVSDTDIWTMACALALEMLGGPPLAGVAARECGLPGSATALAATSVWEPGRLATSESWEWVGLEGRQLWARLEVTALQPRQLVALFGARHWTDRFTNDYFQHLLAAGEAGQGHPDSFLLADEGLAVHVHAFAHSIGVFFEEFAGAFQELMRAGLPKMVVASDDGVEGVAFVPDPLGETLPAEALEEGDLAATEEQLALAGEELHTPADDTVKPGTVEADGDEAQDGDAGPPADAGDAPPAEAPVENPDGAAQESMGDAEVAATDVPAVESPAAADPAPE